MSRKIPTATKNGAFKLWVQGLAYREIHNRTGMSLGAINQMVAEARAKIPNIEELRELNVMLRKSGASVYDAVRGAKLLDTLNERGVGLDTLHSYIELSDRISSERGVEAERFVQSAMKLMKLEGETGKSYGQVVKHFAEKLSEVAGLEGKIEALKGDIQKLTDARAQLERELTQAKEDLTRIVQEVKHMVSAKQRLEKLGLERLNTLAEFIEDFEGLGFDVQEVRKLAVWRESLKKMGISQDGLERFVKEKGPLQAQISKMRSELKDVERKIEATRNEHRRLFEETVSLQAEALKLGKLGKVVKLGVIVIPCKVCGMEGVFVKLHTASEYRSMMRIGAALQYRCIYCGQWATYTPWEILSAIGLLAAPELKEAWTPTVKD